MSLPNSPVKNLRKCYRAVGEAAIINGLRNVVVLPGVGQYKGTWKNNLREGIRQCLTQKTYLSNRQHNVVISYSNCKLLPSSTFFISHDCLVGFGTLTTKNGVIYEGNWINDKKYVTHIVNNP